VDAKTDPGRRTGAAQRAVVGQGYSSGPTRGDPDATSIRSGVISADGFAVATLDGKRSAMARRFGHAGWGA